MRRLFLLLGLAVLMCNSVVAQQQSRRMTRNSFVEPDSKTVYQKWLNEDVLYIITPEEKRAFIPLNSDDEREQFIETFWRRRDPKPETRDNEYRAEHYGRIAYANQNFASASVSGWQTDRGRIYITFGKPDEIRKTSSGEVWFYRSAQGLGNNIEIEFADASGSGDLRLQKQNP